MSEQKSQQDTSLLDWLQSQVVDTIYLDDGRIIDVRGNSVRDAIRAKMKAAVACEVCGGSGIGPSGKCIHTGELVDSDCPECDGRGYSAPARNP